MGSTSGDSHTSWAWWLDALEAMRRAYSIPMDAREAKIRADVEDARRKESAAAAVCRATTPGAVRKSWWEERRLAVTKMEAAGHPEAAAYRKQLSQEHREMWELRSAEENQVDEERWGSDREARGAASYRRKWNCVWANPATLEDTTNIPAMRFTDEPVSPYYHPTGTLQIFSVKVAETAQELQWPLEVYGLIAIRDQVLDRRRNIIFARSRDNCQTITKEDPYFRLIGPTRAVVLCSESDSLRIEVMLKVKGTNKYEDKDFSFLCMKYTRRETDHSCVVNLVGTSRLSRLEWTFGSLVKSVEATIDLQVIQGTWPDGCQGVFTASSTILDDMNILLLSLQDDKLPVTADGMINLSWHVASVEIDGQLKISIRTEYADGRQVSAKDETFFTPRKAGRSCAILNVCSCVMKVIVAWSLVASY